MGFDHQKVGEHQKVLLSLLHTVGSRYEDKHFCAEDGSFVVPLPKKPDLRRVEIPSCQAFSVLERALKLKNNSLK